MIKEKFEEANQIITHMNGMKYRLKKFRDDIARSESIITAMCNHLIDEDVRVLGTTIAGLIDIEMSTVISNLQAKFDNL